jgi:3',5'-cyclic AMP phosphodiesterase CpdA
MSEEPMDAPLAKNPGRVRLLVLSDVHFHSPYYYQHVVNSGRLVEPPSRLSTELGLGDEKQNPFHALMLLARTGKINADALVCCGDLTTCADPTAMNLGWLQLHRLAAELKTAEPIVTAGNHDVDSRFKISQTSPQRMLRYLDPPFPTADKKLAASYWANGYCVIERRPLLRLVLVNTCSLHGYQTESDRQQDHGHIPEQLFEQLKDELAHWDAPINMVVCHHHPTEIDLPAEDRSVITNGGELIRLLESFAQRNWILVHGHRHLPHVGYATSNPLAPIVFSAGSFAASLHLRLQGRTANQFYLLELANVQGAIRGRFEAWTWDQYEGEWQKGEPTLALPAAGGFGFRPDPAQAASQIASIVPAHAQGVISWARVEDAFPDFQFMLPTDRTAILNILRSTYGIDWESLNGRASTQAELLKLGRLS